MKKSGALFAAGCLALSLSLSACGGSGDDAKAAEAISASMMESADDTFTVDQKQADCVGKGLVDKVGVDQLKEYGLLNDDLTMNESVSDVTMSEGDADKSAEVIVGCVDTVQMMTDQMGADDSLTAEQKECVGKALDEDAMKTLFSKMFQGKDEEATKELMGPLMTCMMG